MVGFEWKIFLMLFLCNIFGSFTLSGILSQFEDTNEGTILVHIQASGRNRRSTDGKTHPDKYNLDFSISGTEVRLALQRNDRLTTNVPTILYKNRLMRYEQPNVLQNEAFYQDRLNGGSFLVNFNQDKTETIYGVFQSGGKEYVLQSNETKEEQQQSSGFRKFQIKTARSMKVNDDVIKGVTSNINSNMNSDSNKQNTNRRQKRATGSYSVELLIVVDYAIYQRWYQKSTGSTVSAKEANTIQSIRQFYAFVINGMDDMYKNIQTSSFTINILFAGIIIAQTANDAPWTETIKIQSVVPNQVEATTTLNNFGAWVKVQSNIPGHDHAMLFTGYEMINAGSTVITGYAVSNAVCTTESYSVVEDKFNFMMITVAAHELGHSLGASHDGTANSCLGSNAYIMTSTSIPQTNSVTASNPWKFSTCSTSYFNNYINTLSTSNCMTSLSPTYNPNALQTERQVLPGQLYSADEQCANIVGVGSVMCRRQYSGVYSSLCNVLWCTTLSDSSICRTYIAGDGTQCGDKKWCKTGVCTYSNDAPSGSATCLYGDQRDKVFSNGLTCAALIANGLHYCQQTVVSDACCASCAPSTVAPPTTTTMPTTTTSPTTTTIAIGNSQITGTTTLTTTTTTAPDKEFTYIILGVAAGASVIVFIIIVSMVCCCCNRKPKAKKRRSINRNNLSYIRHSRPTNGYVNRAMVYEETRQPVRKVQRPGSIVVRQTAPKVQRQYSYINHV